MRHDLLEFSTLKEYIRPFVSSDLGLSALSDLSPCDTWEDAEHRLVQLKEMIELINSGMRPAVVAIPDIRPLLSIREGAVLEGQDLVKVAGVLSDMARLRKDLIALGGLLAETASKIEPLNHVSSQISAMLLPTGEISDEAFPLLRDLRSRYRVLRAAILEKLEQILERLKSRSVLMEELITKRNDRFVIPVRHDYHMHMKGIIHDYSRTNRTVYVEPLSIVNENNTLNQIKAQIMEEEYKLLKELTSLIHDNVQEISVNLEVYGKLDLCTACSGWAVNRDASIPKIAGEEIHLIGARHPILLERLGKTATVPLDIRLPLGKDCLIITGPNAGGKTVALKTLGLLIIMAKAGLAIPAGTDSIISPMGNIWVEMDANQDITHDLSSFTAHALALKDIYEHAHRGDLVLLDEPGTGTDHEQGSALAVACIDALRKKGVKVVVTSHSDLVKLYGITADGVENAATAFDDNGLRPLYLLQYGIVGKSRAFEILEAIHFPHELVMEARDIASRRGNTTLAQAIADISKATAMKQEAVLELEEAKKMKAKAEQELRASERERMESALRYKRILEQLEVLSRRPVTRDTVRKVKEEPVVVELEHILIESDPAQSLNIKKGCSVRLKGTGQEGEVVDVGLESAEVVFGTKRARVSLDQLDVIAGPEEKGTARVSVSRMQSVPPVLPIKVVGMRVDEAIPLVEKAVDRAMLTGQDQIEIIHGAGTGRLKRAIREYLKELPCVRFMHDAPMAEGGGNKTIVLLGVK